MNFWTKIANLGVNEKMPVYKQKSTMFFNVSMRAGVLLMLIIAGTMALVDMHYVAIGIILGIPVAAFSLLLNLKGRVELSILITSIFYPLYFIFISVFSKINGEGATFIFYLTPRIGILLLSIASFAVIGFYDIKKSAIAIVFAVASLLLFDYAHKLFNVEMKADSKMTESLVFLRYVFTALYLYFIMIIYSLQKINTQYEDVIKKQNKILSVKNTEINNQKQEIEAQRDEIEAQRDEVKAQRDEVIEQKNKIELQKKEITDSIFYAQRIQQAVLPLESEFDEAFSDHFLFFKPRDIVSGDFYWIKKIDNYIITAVADCTGHGVPGAFMSMLGISYLNEIVTSETFVDAGTTLNLMREKVKKSLRQTGKKIEQKDGMDMVLIAVNYNDLKIQYAGANNPLILIRNKELNIIKPDRMPIGIYGKESSFKTNEFDIKKGDVIYAYSDGYQDQFGGGRGRKFLSKRFKNLLYEMHQEPMNKQYEILNETFESWKKPQNSNSCYKQVDDVLVVGIKV